MTIEELEKLVNEILRPLGAVPEPGEEYPAPPLDVLRFHRRPVRLHWLPYFGRALSIVALVRQPPDLPFNAPNVAKHLERVARAANTRFPPRHAPTLALTVLTLADEPVTHADDSILESAKPAIARARCALVGHLRVHLQTETLAWSLRSSEDFPEPVKIADALVEKLQRPLPLLPSDLG